jgi:hypothetical protein
MLGLLMTTFFGARFIYWFIANQSAMRNPEDPLAGLEMLWAHLKWPLVGIGVFGLACIWSLVTSLQILEEAKRAERRRVPPPLAG